MNNLRNYLLLGLFGSVILLSSCGDDDAPPAENPEEEITRITLTFSSDPSTTTDDIVAVWFDEDPDDTNPATQDEIDLAANTEYTLSITLTNTLEDPAEDITEEVGVDEADEHMLFFGFTADIFTSPAGDGNLGATNRSDDMNYEDSDGANPIGLVTSWTTGAAATGTFTTVLKHQPGATEADPPLKSATSTSETGETDFEIDWVLNIQ